MLCALFAPPVHVTCPAHHILPALIILVFIEAYAY
jgi:hypothetical protein